MGTMKYISLVIALGITLLTSGISCSLQDPYSVGEPDSLFSEYILVRDLVDSYYACFFARENIDWDQAYEKFRSAAQNLNSRDELVDICLQMMSELEDQNLILRDSAGTMFESYNRGDFLNWDLTVWYDYMRDWDPASFSIYFNTYASMVITPTIADNVGYVYLSDLGNAFTIGGFYLSTCPIQYCNSIIIDLRMCSYSGHEEHAYNACGRFIEESGLAYYRSFRTGPGRNDMGEMLEVFACKNGAWQFTEPIILLTGRNTQGAAEQLVMFLRTQDHVTVIGDTTAGFANPAVSFNLTEDWTIEIPCMVTYSPDGTLLFNSGIAPDIVVPATEADFAAGVDPVLDAALEMLAN